jgi:uncharacterized protein YpuA (DUF1002 family)
MKKRIMAMALCLCLLIVSAVPAFAQDFGSTSTGVTKVVSFGADLTQDQKETVLSEMGLSDSDLSSMDVITVTNDEEHQYLDSYLDSSVIGTKALSSVYVEKGASGSGLNITTHNINYCTVAMYKNALITAGLSDATVVVAAPFEISGTAALIGCTKAYSEMTGKPVDQQSLDAATDELVTTGELSQEIGSGDASELIAYLKQYMVEHNLNDRQSIEQAVREKANENNYDLSDEEVSSIVDVLMKISKLNLDVNTLKKQASDLFNGLSGGSASGNASGVGAVFQGIIHSISQFFYRLFGGSN